MRRAEALRKVNQLLLCRAPNNTVYVCLARQLTKAKNPDYAEDFPRQALVKNLEEEEEKRSCPVCSSSKRRGPQAAFLGWHYDNSRCSMGSRVQPWLEPLQKQHFPPRQHSTHKETPGARVNNATIVNRRAGFRDVSPSQRHAFEARTPAVMRSVSSTCVKVDSGIKTMRHCNVRSHSSQSQHGKS